MGQAIDIQHYFCTLSKGGLGCWESGDCKPTLSVYRCFKIRASYTVARGVGNMILDFCNHSRRRKLTTDIAGLLCIVCLFFLRVTFYTSAQIRGIPQRCRCTAMNNSLCIICIIGNRCKRTGNRSNLRIGYNAVQKHGGQSPKPAVSGCLFHTDITPCSLVVNLENSIHICQRTQKSPIQTVH